jgi:hypothetical protein
VTASGNDGNDCLTLLTACATLTRAIAVAPAGASVTLGAGTFKDSVVLTKSLRIIGAGREQTIVDGNELGIVFSVADGVRASISDLTITKGMSAETFRGGGVTNAGALRLENLKITANKAKYGAGVFNTAGGNLLVLDSEISSNIAEQSGGGIVNRGNLRIEKSALINNKTTKFSGGGLINDQGLAALSHVRVSGNEAFFMGGGIYTNKALSVTDSVISNNKSLSATGGGVAVEGKDFEVTIVRSTVSGNDAKLSQGDGLLVQSGASLSVLNSTISGNQERGITVATASTANIAFSTIVGQQYGLEVVNVAGLVQLGGSVIAGNTLQQCTGNVKSLGDNIASDASCSLNQAGDKPSTNPLLAATLSDNGGPTPTYALLAGSPALDGAKNITCPRHDQRGAPRPQPNPGACDIGAFEACR